ncbi:YaiI/YqxD family protein [Clostridium hydrogeniformans]|uniref:YaiI/YqxD family protein n=1 Tax=Clostridium hydrogeniformans TaxID=349933 RepID=UPI000488766A|nr:YaiI/YqxD family protein [Clostridium hydrogeniformans]
MRIIVDGDGCAGKEVIESLAKEFSVVLKLFCSYNHSITLKYGEVKYIDPSFQSVDMVVFNECKSGDIVITQDFGVAAMVLSKGVYSISPKGYIFSDNNMDRLLFERHIGSKVRRGGGRTKGPKKRTSEDDERLYKNLKYLIEKRAGD